jgi:L-alanine-DL-glutamate epimerase-like enolase superfamily enzyme
MPIRHLTIRALDIPFRQTFSHASASRNRTESVLVCAEGLDGQIGYGEGCPRSYVTGETLVGVQEWFHRHEAVWKSLANVEGLRAWGNQNAADIDQNPSAWCAVETACLDLFGKQAMCSIESLLGVPELSGPFRYSAVLGTDSLAAFEKQLKQYAATGFTDYKVKVTGNLADDRRKLDLLNGSGIAGLRIRLDANNLWKHADEARDYLLQLLCPSIIEEPIQVGDYEGCRVLSRVLGVPIVLDESFLRLEQFAHIQGPPSTWIVNIRISKMGGVIRSLAIAERARALGISIVIGAQVGESSILTRTALTVANNVRDILVAQEGAFGTYLLERDICEPSLMFGKEGLVHSNSFRERPGLGLNVTA